MRHDTLSAAQVSALCGVDERTVERWIEEGRFSGAFREHAAGRDHWRVPRATVERFLADRDRPSDLTALIVVFSPVRGNCQTTPAEVQAQIYTVGPDTLHTLCHWLDLDGEPAPTLDDVPIFGDRLERLFALITRPDGTPFTNEAIAQRAGLADGTYVWKLRNKRWRAQDPKLSTIAALARAFGVSPMHFFVHSDVYALWAEERQRQSEEG
jgi:excisionase family DNA binding protein